MTQALNLSQLANYVNSSGKLDAAQGLTGTVTGTGLNISGDGTISGLTVGKGANAVAENTAVGSSALSSGSLSGDYNTAVGRISMQSNTTGNFNSALGRQSLGLNTTGTQNTAIGHTALYSNTTASYNSALGMEALYSNTTGASNVAVGYTALRSNTTASNNTAVGYQAGYSNTTGYANVRIGVASGYSGTTCVANTLVGNSSGYSATTGNSNSFFGESAGYFVSTGSKNTIIGGYNGNQGGLDIRTASNYIVLSDGDGNPRANWNSRGVMTTTNDNADACVYATNSSASSPYGIQMYFSGSAPNNTSQWFHLAQDTGGLRFVVMANGGIKNYSANNVNLSDETVKKDITLAGNYLDKICAIPVKTFLYKDQTDTDLNLGVIAQDVQAVAPELTTEVDWGTKENPDIKLSIYESDLMFAMMKSIQELNAKLEAQALEIATLKAK